MIVARHVKTNLGVPSEAHDGRVTYTDIMSAHGTLIRVAASAHHLPSAPTLVVIPPVGASLGLLESPLCAMAANINVISWELRAISREARYMNGVQGSFTTTLDAHLYDCTTICQRFEAKRVAVAGYCSGASVAIYIAGVRPDQVAALALVNGAFFLRDGIAQQTQYERDLRRLIQPLALGPEVAPSVYSLCLGDECRPSTATVFERELRRPFSNVDSLYSYAISLRDLIALDAIETAARIRCPTLILATEADRITAAESAIRIAAVVPNCRLRMLENSDHYGFPKAAPGVTDEILNFCSHAEFPHSESVLHHE